MARVSRCRYPISRIMMAQWFHITRLDKKKNKKTNIFFDFITRFRIPALNQKYVSYFCTRSPPCYNKNTGVNYIVSVNCAYINIYIKNTVHLKKKSIVLPYKSRWLRRQTVNLTDVCKLVTVLGTNHAKKSHHQRSSMEQGLKFRNCFRCLKKKKKKNHRVCPKRLCLTLI